jgi:hypothetical protein
MKRQRYIGKAVVDGIWLGSDSICDVEIDGMHHIYLPNLADKNVFTERKPLSHFLPTREVIPDSLGEDTGFSDMWPSPIYTGDIVSLQVEGESRYFLVQKKLIDREIVPYGGGQPFLAQISGIVFYRMGEAYLPLMHEGVCDTSRMNRICRAYDLVKGLCSSLSCYIQEDIKAQVDID